MTSRVPTIAATLAACSLLALANVQAADLGPLLDAARAAAAKGDDAAAIDALQRALDEVRAEAPLAASPFLLVTRPAQFFGDYAPRADAVFGSGEALQFYLEPKNLVHTRSTDGTYRPGLEVDLEIFTADGQSVGRQPKFASLELATKSAVHDIFLNLKVSLSGAPAGGYRVAFVVRDLNSSKTLTVTQPITIR